jgi:hypothetical protein
MVAASAHDLFGLDPNDFVAARDELARELRSRGEKDEAKAVKAMRRPTVPIWALNQVARENRASVDALIDAGSQAQAAKGEAVREALAQRRQLLHDVVRTARDVIERSGRSGDPHELDITSALSTILASGRLTHDLLEGELTQVTDEGGEIEWPDISDISVQRAPSRELLRAREELERRRNVANDAEIRFAEAERAANAAREAVARAEQEVARLENAD